jgi:hypothetical protein
MADYFHSALRGEQIHESKIKILPSGSPMPTPEWEGQFVVIDKSLYYSIKQNNTLTWTQPVAYNTPTLPANVVTFESGYENPPAFRSGSGKVYTNLTTKDTWYLSASQWLKLGKGSKNFDVVSGRAAENWMGNYFGLLNPPDPLQDNCLAIVKYQVSTKYYFAIQTPTMLSLGGSDDNLFYLELCRDSTRSLISTHVEAKESLAIINTSGWVSTSTYRIGLYVKRNSTKLYLNFAFSLDTRLIDIKQIANISYGY